MEDLELEGQEVSVGGYNADLVFRGGDSIIVVENMLGSTDHDHIGKLITYAASLNASQAVLLAEDFRPEHRSALNWLNRVSAEDCSFFGLSMKVWRIGDSLPALHLCLDVQPDGWHSARRRRNRGSQIYYEWWRAFLNDLRESDRRWSIPRPSRGAFVDLGSDSHGVMYEASYEEEDEKFAGTAYFKHEGDDGAPQTFTHLQSRKDTVESKCESELIWEPEHQRGWAAVWSSREASIGDPAKWDEARSWQVSFMNRLRDEIESVLDEMDDSTALQDG